MQLEKLHSVDKNDENAPIYDNTLQKLSKFNNQTEAAREESSDNASSGSDQSTMDPIEDFLREIENEDHDDQDAVGSENNNSAVDKALAVSN